MKRPAISILTPTYNRAHVLHRVYDSLKRQKTRDFEWVLVDDGSTDDTSALLERWQEEADFPIGWYRYENNRGRNAAVNSGATLVSGDYTLILDSDDELLDDALETVAYWRERSGIDAMPSVSGLYFRCVDQRGALVGRRGKGKETALPRETMRVSVRKARYRFGMTFEFISIVKTDISRERRFLELTDSEHGPLIITHMEMSKRYETIYVDQPIRRYFRNDGEIRLSDRTFSAIKWPRGNYLRALAILNDDIEFLWRSPKQFLNASRKITRLGLHIGRPLRLQFRDLDNWRGRLLWMAAISGGFAGYIRDRLCGCTVPNADLDISAWGPAAPPENLERHLSSRRFRNAVRTETVGSEITK